MAGHVGEKVGFIEIKNWKKSQVNLVHLLYHYYIHNNLYLTISSEENSISLIVNFKLFSFGKGSTLWIWISGVEWKRWSLEAAVIYPNQCCQSCILSSTWKSCSYLGSCTPGWKCTSWRTACYFTLPIICTPQYCCSCCPHPSLPMYLKTDITASHLQYISSQWHSSPGPSGHKSQTSTFPNHPSDSIQTNFPTTFLHCITCLHRISIESDKTQPVSIYVKTPTVC